MREMYNSLGNNWMAFSSFSKLLDSQKERLNLQNPIKTWSIWKQIIPPKATLNFKMNEKYEIIFEKLGTTNTFSLSDNE